MNPCLVLLNLSNMKLSDFQNQAHERTKNVEEQNDQKINIIKLKKNDNVHQHEEVLWHNEKESMINDE